MKYIAQLLVAASLLTGSASLANQSPQENDERWGDLGDGTFANPVLNADYSDPDVIRVGEKYYMTCSEFHFMGMPILESDDMVNWHIIGQVFDSIGLDGYSTMDKYGSGSWAPALRYHDGKFWIFVCTPGEGLFMATAENPAGPWSELYNVKNVSGWEDPCPLWDEDGNAYLGRSQLGGGPIIIHRMATDGKSLLDDGVKVYEGPTAEGTKLFKRDGYYYLSIPEGGVGTGWQTVLRSKSIYGPYEGRRVLETGSTNINGPHQGALVDTPDGNWWFFHFQSAGALGRVVHLQPVVWEGGFPIIGTDYDHNGVGEPMKISTVPLPSKTGTPVTPQTSDDFDSKKLGIQWQFNHNPDRSRISLESRKGWLAVAPLPAPGLRHCRNQLTQKLMGYRGEVMVTLDFAQMRAGDFAGLECIGNKFMAIGVKIDSKGVPQLCIESDGEQTSLEVVSDTSADCVYLRLDFDATAKKFQFYYSLDGTAFVKAGAVFEMSDGDWKGCRTGLFAYTGGNADDAGTAYFDNYNYKHDGN